MSPTSRPIDKRQQGWYRGKDCFIVPEAQTRFGDFLLPFTLRVHGNARVGIAYPPRIRSLNGRNSPSWGDCSLSADLAADGIPAAGGHRRFVPPPGFSSQPFGPPGRKNRKECFPDGKPRPRGKAPRYDYSRGSSPDTPLSRFLCSPKFVEWLPLLIF